jgi:putative transposase
MWWKAAFGEEAGVSRGTSTDAQWQRIEARVPGEVGDRGATGEDNRLFVDAVLWVARTGAPWRDLPPEFGHWDTVWRRFGRWSKAGVWQRLFATLADDPDFEHVIPDAPIVRAHQHAAGAKGGGSGSGPRPRARRPEHQAAHRRGRARQSLARPAHPRPAPRGDPGGARSPRASPPGASSPTRRSTPTAAAPGWPSAGPGP